MPFKAYLPTGFEHAHENAMFDSLVRVLTQRFKDEPGLYILIGNVMFNGVELDAIFIKRNAISVVEMKNYGGKIHFSENTEWYADELEVKGGRYPNPFLQVRAYRFTLMGWLKQFQGQFISSPQDTRWGQVNGVVLFGKPIVFDERVGPWFHVTDLDRVANKLAGLHSSEICLSDLELEKFLQLRGFQNRHLYTNSLPAGKPLETIAVTGARPLQIQIVYHKESNFRDHELRMRNAGGARSAGAMIVRHLFDTVRHGRNPFSERESTEDDRVHGARIFQINDVCLLVMIQAGRNYYPFFLGDPGEVQHWLSAHAGMTLAVDGLTSRITTTVITTEMDQANLPAPSPTADNLPYFSRVKGLDLSSLVPQRLICRHLEELDEESTDEEAVEILEALPNADLRAFLRDIISLIRVGDIAGAETRISLRSGEASPLKDAGLIGDEAASSIVNSDQVVVVNDLSKEELDRLLDPVHFQDWMLFLHPDQKRVAEADFDRPVVLTGVSGSGKTCILVHRARHLARKYPNERIGVMTLNRSLAKLLKNLVCQLCTEEERRNIFVMAFYDYFRELIHHLGPDRYLQQLLQLAPGSQRLQETVALVNKANFANEIDLRSGETAADTWEDFFNARDPEVKGALMELEGLLREARIDASRYLQEECTLVRSGLALVERGRYLDATEYPRVGRGNTPQFLARQRQQVLKILLLFEEWMIHGAVVDMVELTQALTPAWREIRQLPESKKFRCLLVDEFQDLSTLDIRLLGHVVTEQENGLFLSGDTVQRILVKRLKLADAGLAKGSFTQREIKKNYRNSRQILRAASTLANHYGKLAGLQGEEIEVLDPELAQRETNPPIVLQTDNQICKAWELALECIKGDNTEPWTVCIATAAPENLTIDSILAQQPENMEADVLSGDCIRHTQHMVVGSIHDLKGFEFRLVVIIGCERRLFPATGVAPEEVWRDALRLYVAMTRARDQLFLLYEREPSEFVNVMGSTVIQRQEPIIHSYQRKPQPVKSPEPSLVRATTSTTSKTLRKTPAEWDLNCESWFDDREVDLLKRYFDRFARRDNLSFQDWCKPRVLVSLRPKQFFSLRNCSSRLVNKLLDKMNRHGLRLS